MRSAVSHDSTVRYLAGKRALIVDDDDDARYLLRAVLESCQMTVSDSDSVDGALAAFDQGEFDVIVSDIGMPDRDGYALIHALRGRPDGSTVPTIALTSFVRPDDRERALRAGFDRHCGKPLDSTAFVGCLKSLLTGQNRSS